MLVDICQRGVMIYFQDLRVKVDNAQARKTDARTKIALKRQQQPKSSLGPQIRVTGLGNPNLLKGGITKTISTKGARSNQVTFSFRNCFM